MRVRLEIDEQRDFGRHPSERRAWVLLRQDHRIACIIRNFSPKGALLEFVNEMPGTNEFTLMLDQDFTIVRCTVSHRKKSAIGVNFGKVEPPALRHPDRPRETRTQSSKLEALI